MGYAQLKAPNPNIPCQPGWCLAYVNEAFGVPKKYPSATAAWYGSRAKHEDRDFPAGVAVPVWYGLDTTPLGHVVIRMADGSVYSTSDLTNVPHHHPNLADLERYYAYYGMNLTYRGWTEDVEDTPVVASIGLAAQAYTITPLAQEEDMGFVDGISDEAAAKIAGHMWNFDYTTAEGRPAKPLWLLQSLDAIIRETITKTAQATAQVILNTEVPNVMTGGKTSLGTQVSWLPQDFENVKHKIGNVPVSDAPSISPDDVAKLVTEGIQKATDGLSITLTAQKGN